MSGPAEDNRPFLRALARRAGVRVVLYVPLEESARTIWASAANEPDDGKSDGIRETARLDADARRFLAALDTEPNGPDLPSHEIAVAVRSTNSEVLGAVLAAKQPGEAWSEAERGVVHFAVDFYGLSLDRRAAPPTSPRDPGALRVGPDLDTDIRDAVDRDELSLVYQPEVDLLTRRVVAVEALLRWQHPTRGELPPAAFIEQAERSGLIKVIGAWVINESIRALGQWRAEVPGADVLLRINVSPVQMIGPDVVGLFRTALETHDVPGRQVSIELTENAPLRDTAEVAQTLRSLKDLGVTAAIDDLATGYSTLSQLRALPVDVIKIDRSLVSGIDSDARAEAIVTALIGLALNFGLQVIGEGVETEGECETLLRLGCTRAQGHHLGKPVPPGEVAEMLRERGNVFNEMN